MTDDVSPQDYPVSAQSSECEINSCFTLSFSHPPKNGFEYECGRVSPVGVGLDSSSREAANRF